MVIYRYEIITKGEKYEKRTLFYYSILFILLFSNSYKVNAETKNENYAFLNQTENAKPDFEYTVSPENTITITKYNGNAEELILDQIEGKDIVSIRSQAFEDNATLRKITLGNKVVTIGWCAFRNCVALDEVIFEENSSLEIIDSSAFQNCSSLNSIILPESLTEIGGGAFEDCINLISLEIPEKIQEASYSIFDGCTSLKRVILPENLKTFYWCGDATRLEAQLLFRGSEENITFEYRGVDITSINNSASLPFFDFVSIKENDKYVYGVDKNNYAIILEYKGNEKNLRIGIDEYVVKDMAKDVFKGNNFIEKVTFDENTRITVFQKNVFAECSNLKSIYIPKTIKKINNYALCNSYHLKDIYYEGTVEDWCNISMCSVFFGIDIDLYTLENGQEYTLLTDLYIPESIEKIGQGQFSNIGSIKSLTIHKNVTEIGDSAFNYCWSLGEVTIEEGTKLTTIGWQSFNYCPLKYFLVPEVTKNLSMYSFPYSHKERNKFTVLFEADLSEINFSQRNEAEDWFDNVLLITKNEDFVYAIDKNNNACILEYIGNKSIVDLSIEGLTVTQVGYRAFYNREDVEIITIPSSVRYIGSYAFYRCTSLINIIFEENSQIKRIGSYAFYE